MARGGQSYSNIESFVETITGILVDPYVPEANGKVDSLGGGKTASTTIAGTMFAVHLGAGELIYHFASLVNFFEITLAEGGGRDGVTGLGLSNFRVFKDTCTQNCGGGGGDPNPVPVPGALPLLLTGIAGFGFLATRRKKTIAA
jgi:hypothetical protein